MSKKNSKLGSFTKGLKGKFSGLFKKKSAQSEDFDEYDEEVEGEFEDEYEEDYDDDDIEGELQAAHQQGTEEDQQNNLEEELDDEFDDETDPCFQPLNVNDIKASQAAEGDIPPNLPQIDDDEEDYSPEDNEDNYDEDWDGTSPSLKSFDPNHKSGLKEKLSQMGQGLRAKFKAQAPGAGSSSFSALYEKALNGLKEINIDEIFDSFFSPQQRPRIHKTFIAALFISSAYLTGRLISGWLTPLPKSRIATKGQTLSLNQQDVVRTQLNRIKSNDLFQAPDKTNTPVIDNAPKKPSFEEVRVCRDANMKSSLGLKLVNTVILQDSVKSLASVQMRGKENFLREGDSIPNTIEVGKITRQKLIFKNLKTRKCEYIENTAERKGPKKTINIVRDPQEGKKILQDAGETGISNVGNTFKIKKEVRARMLENISEVLTQARAVQIKNPDGSLAFRMQEIVPGSIYSQLNIQEGDVITGINGKKITNMTEMMNLFGQIDKVDHFELTLSRNGMEQNLEYDFE